ncbi:MAG: hypothetical protein HS115_14215 [Spirochaetales bacterium]|nr:hypothetical protein [Spirochaetales bacterium]
MRRLLLCCLPALSLGCQLVSPECLPYDLSCNPLSYFALFPVKGAHSSFYGELSIGRDGHNLRLFPDGVLVSWGPNSNGRLGRNNTTAVGDGIGPSILAAGPVNLGVSPRHVSAGHQFSCAVYNQALRCWGFNDDGQLGDNSTVSTAMGGVTTNIENISDVPVGETVDSVAAADLFTCALLVSGKVRCWGDGMNRVLGYGDTDTVGDGVGPSIISKGDVTVDSSRSVVQIATGSQHACALLSDGNVRCWGYGTNGRLGYNNTVTVGDSGTSIVAAGDVPLGGRAVQISLGAAHTCALLDTGAVRCWGQGSLGQLGYGNVNDVGAGGTSIISAGDVPVGGSVSQISAGVNHTCALLSTRKVRCWGNGTNGKLGYNSTQSVGSGAGIYPNIVDAGDVPVGADVALVTASSHTCAVLTTRATRCWGDGAEGKLGYGNTSHVGDGLGLSIIAAGDVPVR